VKPLSRLKLTPLDASGGLRRLACDAIKHAIAEMDIYGHVGELWIDERQLSQDLRVSRTPIREALRFLEQEGLVRSVPRRGVHVVRKTKSEVVDMIIVWAAIEGMAARLAASRASAEQLRGLRELFAAFKEKPSAHLTEYSQANMAFHRAIIDMGGCTLMGEMTNAMFLHMRAVRAVTIRQDNRVRRSIDDHLGIIAALECSDADLAERLVREHTLGLAAHVEQHGALLDGGIQQAPAKAVSAARGKVSWLPAGGRHRVDRCEHASEVKARTP
jgi:DNA-binding GntR family transcriptional regulator